MASKLASILSGNHLSPATTKVAQARGPRRRWTRLSGADRAKIVMRYQTGEPSTALATEFGVAKTTILGVLRENNVVMRRQSLTSEQLAEAAKLYTAGSSLSQVAAELNLKQDTVRLALKAGGVQLRPRTGG